MNMGIFSFPYFRMCRKCWSVFFLQIFYIGNRCKIFSNRSIPYSSAVAINSLRSTWLAASQTSTNSGFSASKTTAISLSSAQENAGDGYGLAPIGHLVTVKSAEGIEINVTSNLTFEPGYGWNNLQGELNRAVSEYLLELRKA